MGSLDPPPTSTGGKVFTPTLTTDVNPAGEGPPSDPSGIQPENETFRKRRSGIILPLEVGTRVMCRWRDGKYHPVKVIERRRLHSDGPNEYEYYVHYTECKNLIYYCCLFQVLVFRVKIGLAMY